MVSRPIRSLLHRILVWALLLTQCSAANFTEDFTDWLQHPMDIYLSSDLLKTFVPTPLNPEDCYGYDRFSLLAALHRVYRGNAPIKHERPLLISEEEVHRLTTSDYRLGLVYFWSLGGIERNLTRAFEHFKAAADQGHPDAMFMVAVAYATGYLGDEGPPQDQALATLYYKFAADSGSLEAQIALGHRKKFGIYSPIDLDTSLAYYEAAGDAVASYLDIAENGVSPQFFTRVNKLTFAFGAELNTGLYGRHAYKKRIAPKVDRDLPMGDQTAAWRFVSYAFPNEFVDLAEAIDTLQYRAIEEENPTAMYALAQIYAAGVDTEGPDWVKAFRYAKKCLGHDNTSPQRFMLYEHSLKIRALCAEFLAERLLHGGEGVKQNVSRAEKFYNYAANITGMQGSCQSGLVLCEFQTAIKNGTLPLDEEGEVDLPTLRKLFYRKFVEAFKRTRVSSDYTLPIILAKLHLYNNATDAAVDTLRKTISECSGNVPVASFMLAKLLGPTDARLERYIQGLYAVEDLYSPSIFAIHSYDHGDVESAMLAFMISSELGSRSAPLNLADLLEVQHSMIGSKYKSKYESLRSITEWPIPYFVADRVRLAVHYFALAAAHGSIDGLTKLIEYSKTYDDVIPERLARWYLETLVASNFGLAQWTMGTIEQVKGNYKQAMDRYMRALVSPEAWLPVKLSQFVTFIQMLREDNGESFWTKVKVIYQYMSSFEPNLKKDDVDPFSVYPRSDQSQGEEPWQIHEHRAQFEESQHGTQEVLEKSVVVLVILSITVYIYWALMQRRQVAAARRNLAAPNADALQRNPPH